jgi:hypothetical protein
VQYIDSQHINVGRHHIMIGSRRVHVAWYVRLWVWFKKLMLTELW